MLTPPNLAMDSVVIGRVGWRVTNEIEETKRDKAKEVDGDIAVSRTAMYCVIISAAPHRVIST